MPDLIENGEDHIIWADELCASCLNVGNCPLISVLHEHQIETYSGVHVFRCQVYEADIESANYIEPDKCDPERVAQQNLKALEQEADLLLKTLKKAIPWRS